MKLLLDSHIFLWGLSEPNRLSKKQIAAMEDPTNKVYLSSISITEIAIKASLGKLELSFDPIDAAERSGFEMLDFSAKDALLLKDLPFHHRDPFDRMLITQAISRKLIFVTQDSLMDPYDCRTLGQDIPFQINLCKAHIGHLGMIVLSCLNQSFFYTLTDKNSWHYPVLMN